MPPKADPYNTRLHRRIDALLLVFTFVIVAILLSTSAEAANATNNYTGSGGSLLTPGNWSLGHVPTASEDAVFTSTGIRTLTAGALTVGSFDVTATTGTFSIRNETTTATNSTLTLGGTGNLGNGVSGTAAGDLLYAASGSTFNIIGPNGSTGTGVLNVVLGQSGNFNAAGTINISSTISDGGNGFGITKTGAGTLILGGANSFGGGVTINAGIVRAGSTTALGPAASATLTFGSGSTGKFQLFGFDTTVGGLNSNTITLGSPIIENGASGPAILTVNDSGTDGYAGVLQNGAAGTLALTKSGAGTLVLKGVNTYSGDTQINAGDLRFDAGGTSNSSTIRLGATNGSNVATLSLGVGNGNNVGSALEVRSGGTGVRVLRSLGTSGVNTYSGGITMNAGLTLESSGGGTLLLQGGSVGFGTSTMTIDTQSGQNGSNTVGGQGAVTINELMTSSSATGGSLVKDGGNTLAIQTTGNTYTGNSAAGVALNTNGTRIAGGTLAIAGDTSLGLAPSVATNNIFFTDSSLSSPPSTRTLQVSGNVSLAATRSINVAGGVTGTLNNNGNTFTINGNINGAGATASTGGGRTIFTNANTYTGGTTVQSGTLLVNNSTGSGTGTGAVIVNNGGTLGGAGFINTGANNVTVNGTVAPGSAANAVGSVSLTTASTIFGSASTFLVDLSGATTDQLLTSGSFNLLALGDTITFNTLGSLTQSSYTLATFSGVALGIFDNVVNLPPGYNLVYNVGELDLVLTEVPEPSTWVCGALALVFVSYMQRKRLRTCGLRTAERRRR